MKRASVVTLFFMAALCTVLNADIQQEKELTLNPSRDALVFNNTNPGYSYTVDHNYGSSSQFKSWAWTHGGYPTFARSLMDFDLTSIPEDSYILEATLTLHGIDHVSDQTHTSSGYKSNASVLMRITGPWDENAVTWNNQPFTTVGNATSVASSSSRTQNYNVNVTAMVQDMVTHPRNSHGFMIRLVNETRYARMVFASSEYNDPSKRPVLHIKYSPTKIFSRTELSPSKDAFVAINNNSSYAQVQTTNYGDRPDLKSTAWTHGGSPTYWRSLIEFDLNALPFSQTYWRMNNSYVIHKATLHLYGTGHKNTTIMNNSGYKSNACWVEKVAQSWDESTVNWVNQPTMITTNRASLEDARTSTQNYEVDVTQLLRDSYQNREDELSLMIRLKDEQHYATMEFASSDHPEKNKHPWLEIVYKTREAPAVTKARSYLKSTEDEMAAMYLGDSYNIINNESAKENAIKVTAASRNLGNTWSAETCEYIDSKETFTRTIDKTLTGGINAGFDGIKADASIVQKLSSSVSTSRNTVNIVGLKYYCHEVYLIDDLEMKPEAENLFKNDYSYFVRNFGNGYSQKVQVGDIFMAVLEVSNFSEDISSSKDIQAAAKVKYKELVGGSVDAGKVEDANSTLSGCSYKMHCYSTTGWQSDCVIETKEDYSNAWTSHYNYNEERKSDPNAEWSLLSRRFNSYEDYFKRKEGSTVHHEIEYYDDLYSKYAAWLEQKAVIEAAQVYALPYSSLEQECEAAMGIIQSNLELCSSEDPGAVAPTEARINQFENILINAMGDLNAPVSIGRVFEDTYTKDVSGRINDRRIYLQLEIMKMSDGTYSLYGFIENWQYKAMYPNPFLGGIAVYEWVLYDNPFTVRNIDFEIYLGNGLTVTPSNMFLLENAGIVEYTLDEESGINPTVSNGMIRAESTEDAQNKYIKILDIDKANITPYFVKARAEASNRGVGDNWAVINEGY